MCKKQIGDILAIVPKGEKHHNSSWLLNIGNIEMKNFHYMMSGRFTYLTSLIKKKKKNQLEQLAPLKTTSIQNILI